MEIIFLFIHLGFATLILFLTLAFITGAPYVPTPINTAKKMVDYAKLKKGSVIIDLGSGDGRLLFMSASKGALSHGYEINPYLVLLTNFYKLFRKSSHLVKPHWKNFWSADVSHADCVFIYLLPWRMANLETKLKKELKKGALVVSHSFIFDNWKPFISDNANHIYVYKKT